MSCYDSLHSDIKLTTTYDHISVDFLDLTIYINTTTIPPTLLTKIFQKPMNKYLYIPPISFHPLHCYRGFIRGILQHYRICCSPDSDFYNIKLLFYKRLLDRNYSTKFISPIFKLPYSRTPHKALRLHNKPKSNPLIFITRYTPLTRLLNFQKIFNILNEDKEILEYFDNDLKHIFKHGIHIAYKSNKNLLLHFLNTKHQNHTTVSSVLTPNHPRQPYTPPLSSLHSPLICSKTTTHIQPHSFTTPPQLRTPSLTLPLLHTPSLSPPQLHTPSLTPPLLRTPYFTPTQPHTPSLTPLRLKTPFLHSQTYTNTQHHISPQLIAPKLTFHSSQLINTQSQYFEIFHSPSLSHTQHNILQQPLSPILPIPLSPILPIPPSSERVHLSFSLPLSSSNSPLSTSSDITDYEAFDLLLSTNFSTEDMILTQLTPPRKRKSDNS